MTAEKERLDRVEEKLDASVGTLTAIHATLKQIARNVEWFADRIERTEKIMRDDRETWQRMRSELGNKP